jgi:hypothetical protein
LVPALGLGELCGHLWFAARAPRLGDWVDVRRELVTLHQPGDLVVVAPSWAEPLARYAFGERNLPLRDLARPDATAYARAIEVSVLAQSAAELRGFKELLRVQHGKFRLRVLENARATPVHFDFVDELSPARVRVFQSPADDSSACEWTSQAAVVSGALASPPTFPARRFQCSGTEFYFVGVTVVDDEQFRPRRCIWAHPTSSGEVRIVFERVPIGRVLRGHGTLPWLILRDATGTPINLEIFVGGEHIGSYVHHDGEGWTEFEFRTGAHAGRTESVEFVVHSQSIQDRHFCFQADMR